MMSAAKAAQIQVLCDAFYNSVVQPDGSVQFSPKDEQNRLCVNGYLPHTLEYDELQAAYAGLAHALLMPRFGAIVHSDHYAYWAWAGDILVVAPLGDPAMRLPPYMHSMLDSVIRALIAPFPSGGTLGSPNDPVRVRGPGWHLLYLMEHRFTIAGCTTFPLLEAFLRDQCRAFVHMSGTVIAPFSVQDGTSANLRSYNVNQRCNSVRDLLWLYHRQVASANMQIILDQYRGFLQRFDPNSDPYDILYRWRNGTLHGEREWGAAGGATLNLAILIGLDKIAPDYERRRQIAIARCTTWADRANRDGFILPPCVFSYGLSPAVE